MQQRTFATVVGLLWGGLAFSLETMPVQRAPFPPGGEQVRIQRFAGTETKDGLAYGNKLFQKDRTSECRIATAAQTLAEIHQHAATLHRKRWFSPASPEFRNIPSGRWVDEAVLPADDADTPVRYRQAIRRRADGILEFECSWQTADEEKLRECGVFVCLPMEGVAGRQILLDGKSHPVKDASQFGTFQKSGDGVRIGFYPDRPEHAFTLQVTSPYRLVGQTIQGKELVVRILPLGRLRTLRFQLDLTSGTAAEPPGRTFAGVDFLRTDRLEVPDWAARRNLLPNPSFESGVQFYTTWGGGNASYPEAPVDLDEDFLAIDLAAPFSGHRSLRMKAPVKFPAISLSTGAVPFEEGGYVVSFYARSPEPCILKAQALFNKGSSPWNGGVGTFQTTQEWRRHSFKVESVQGTGMCLLLSARSAGDRPGSVNIDALQIEKGAVPTAFEPEPACSLLLGENVFNVGAVPRLELLFTSETGASGTAQISILDWHDRTLSSFEESWHDRAWVALPIPGPLPPGLYRIRVDYGARQEFHRFSVMDFRDGRDRLKGFFSFSYSGATERSPLLERYARRWRRIGIGADAYVAAPRQVCELLARYDIASVNATMFYRVWRNGGVWYALLPGGPVFRGQQAAALLDDFRLESPDWTLTEEYRRRFRSQVQAYAAKYPWITTWTFSGEDEPKWPDWAGLGASAKNYETYVQLQIDFAEAVRAGNPAAKITTNPACNISPEAGIKITERFLKALKGRLKYDYVGIHTYQTTPYPLDREIAAFLRVVDANGHEGVPVILPEGMHYGPYEIPRWRIASASWGPPTFWYFGTLSYDLGWMEKRSAAWYARSYLVCLKYSDRVKAATSGASQNFALDLDLTPRMYQNAINALASLLGDSVFKEDIAFAPGVRCLVFEDALRRPVVAVWNEDPAVDGGRAEAPWYVVHKLPLECFDMAGGAYRADEAADGDGLRFQASPFPVYFRGGPDTLSAVAQCFREAAPENLRSFNPIGISAKLRDAGTVSVKMRNLISRAYSGRFVIGDGTRSLEFAGSEEKELLLPLARPLSPETIRPVAIPVRPADETKGGAEFNAFAVKRMASGDWSRIPEIPLVNRTLNRPGLEKIADEDFSGGFQLAYDERFLYLRVRIRDDRFHRDKADGWNNDTLQIYLDTFADGPSKGPCGFDDNDYTFNIYPSADGRTARVWRELSPDPQLGLANNAPPDLAYEDNIPVTFTRTADGYVYEVRFPGKYILPIDLAAGSAFGFGLFVNDRDDAEGVKSSLTLTPPGTGCYRKPHLWPQAILLPAEEK